MTMRDPDMRTTTVRDRRGSNWGWIAGALVVLLLLGALAFSWNRTDTTASNTGNAGSAASNTNASAPASTTGSAAGTTGSTSSSAGRTNVPPAGSPAR
jgi:hypothetical protein